METVTNLDDIVASVNLVQRTSAKSGVRYEMLQLVFNDGDNDYTIEIMPPERSQVPLIHKLLNDSKKK